MKQSIGDDHGSTMLTADDAEVVEILVQLPRLILESEARRRFPFTWGCKRRRSAIHAAPSPPPLRLSSSPTPPSPLHRPACGGAVVAPSCDAESLPAVKAEAPSPATPLSFSPSESDEKPKLLRRKASLQRKREHYLKMTEELTKTQDLLNREIEKVKGYYDQLKATNLKLKAKKQELSIGFQSRRENPSLETGSQMQLVHASVNSSNSIAENQQQLPPFPLPSTPHYPPLMLNQTSGPSPTISDSEGIVQFQTTSLPSPSALGMVNKSVGPQPLEIPDLNVSLVEESNPVDSGRPLDASVADKNLSRVMAAQARHKRMQIHRMKNPFGISKPRYSYR